MINVATKFQFNNSKGGRDTKLPIFCTQMNRHTDKYRKRQGNSSIPLKTFVLREYSDILKNWDLLGFETIKRFLHRTVC